MRLIQCRRTEHRPTSITAVTQRFPAPRKSWVFVPATIANSRAGTRCLRYFDKLDQASDRVKFEALGKSTMDVPFVMATISAPENLARLDEYKKIQELLADPRKLGAPTSAIAKPQN